MQSVIRSGSMKLPSPQLTLGESEQDVRIVRENCQRQVDMTNLCTTRNGLFPAITTRPLNLTLLNKRKREEEDLEMSNHVSDEEDYVKKARVSDHEEDVAPSDETENLPKDDVHDEKREDQKDSRASILQHFYSFIQRKGDKSGDEGKSKSESDAGIAREGSRSPGIGKHSPPANHHASVICNINNKERNVSPTAMVGEMYGFDYNTLVSQRLARANASNLLEFWSSLGNMYARAKRTSEDGSHATSPPIMNIGVDAHSMNSFATSPNTTSAIPERTMRQNNWAVKVWRDWATDRNARATANGKTGPFDIVPLDIKDASLEGMSYWLPKFITEVRRRDKRPYPPDTLMQIASGLQRHLRHVSGRNDITFFDKYSPTFAEFREALKARSEAINSESSLTQRGEHDASGEGGYAGTDGWGTSLFNLTTAKGIFRAIFYYNCVAFHITSMEEHHALAVAQYRIGYDEEKRQEYLEFTRDNGSQPVRKYATPYDPRCIVNVFKTYFQHIPSAGLLYKRPLQSSESSDLRFSFNPVGINKLRETFKLLFGGRRSGAHMTGGIDDDEERDGSMHSILRLQSNTDDLQRSGHLERSPGSEASSEAVSYRSRTGSGTENQTQENEENHHRSSPHSQCVKTEEKFAASEGGRDAMMSNVASRAKVLLENNNNNAAPTEEDDCLTLKVPPYVKYVMIQQGSRKIKIDLATIS